MTNEVTEQSVCVLTPPDGGSHDNNHYLDCLIRGFLEFDRIHVEGETKEHYEEVRIRADNASSIKGNVCAWFISWLISAFPNLKRVVWECLPPYVRRRSLFYPPSPFSVFLFFCCFVGPFFPLLCQYLNA